MLVTAVYEDNFTKYFFSLFTHQQISVAASETQALDVGLVCCLQLNLKYHYCM